MKKLILSACVVAFFATTTITAVDVVRFPEKYITTYRQQLKNDIANGNEKAIEYYQKKYVATGKPLFEEFDYLNLDKVKSYRDTAEGLFLETWDGQQYFIEK